MSLMICFAHTGMHIILWFLLVQVTRVQNAHNHALYEVMKKNVAEQLGKQLHEVETTPLWHATREDNIQKITHSHFDRGLSGAVGRYINR